MPHVVYAVKSTIYIQTNIHDTEMHGNNRLPPIDRMTVSPDTYCIGAKAAG